jgi:hypothetical protein
LFVVPARRSHHWTGELRRVDEVGGA